MAKKIIIIVIIALVASVIFINPLTSWMCKKGFEERNPDQVLTGANVKMKILKYTECAKIYTKFLEKFPESKDKPKVYFKLAMCLEKSGKTKEAKEWYEKLKSEYPEHQWADQGIKRIKNIEANE